MERNSKFIMAILLDGIMGAVGVSILAHIYHLMFGPEGINDERYIVLFIFTFPIGYMIGSLVGMVIHPQDQLPEKPGIIMSVLLLLGTLVSPFLFLLLMLILKFVSSAFGAFAVTVILYFLAVLWLFLLVFRTYRRIKRRPT
jgi:hypothetical protein